MARVTRRRKSTARKAAARATGTVRRAARAVGRRAAKTPAGRALGGAADQALRILGAELRRLASENERLRRQLAGQRTTAARGGRKKTTAKRATKRSAKRSAKRTTAKRTTAKRAVSRVAAPRKTAPKRAKKPAAARKTSRAPRRKTTTVMGITPPAPVQSAINTLTP